MAPAPPPRRLLLVFGLCLLAAWGASGLVIVPDGARAVTGAAVLRPGLHVGPPWPIAVRRVEFGRVHDVTLAGAPYLVASGGAPGAAVQSVSAGLQVLYRTGLADADARAVLSVESPAALVRADLGCVAAAYFAAHAVDAVLSGERQALEAALQTRLQARLDAAMSGLEVVAVVVAFVHPPEGAAAAYEAERAAGTGARTAVAVAHVTAATEYARSGQRADAVTASARAAAGEALAAAKANQVRFGADQAAAKAAGTVFLMERYFASLKTALAGVPATIVDHRLNWPEAPVLDLRPLSAAASHGTGKEAGDE